MFGFVYSNAVYARDPRKLVYSKLCIFTQDFKILNTPLIKTLKRLINLINNHARF